MTGEIAVIMMIVGIALLVAGGRIIGRVTYKRQVRRCKHESTRTYVDGTTICCDCDHLIIEVKR
ncbi:hypothetical protein ACQ3HE_06730 [Plantibacter auratus]|uniref:hypothetical protein n=1 Tax=Plantibacter auratus TaxID=272914 RepID=UPI003D33A36C